MHKWLQQPAVGQANARSLEFHPGLPCEWQKTKELRFFLGVLAESCKGSGAVSTETSFHMGCWCLRQLPNARCHSVGFGNWILMCIVSGKETGTHRCINRKVKKSITQENRNQKKRSDYSSTKKKIWAEISVENILLSTRDI